MRSHVVQNSSFRPIVGPATFGPMTVLLLHPLPLDGSMWPSGMPALGPRVLAPTLYGLGDSIGDWAAGVLELAGPGPLVVVGNSIGGSCAVEVASLAPERVRLLVLIGAKPGHRPEPGRRDEAVRLLSDAGIEAAWERYWAPLFAPGADAGVVARARAIACSQPVDDVIRGVQVFHGRPDRSAFLESVDLPVLVVSGEHDRTPSGTEAIAARLCNGTFRRVTGAGHYVPLERPVPLTAMIRQAIDGQGLGSGPQ